ncbi:MAG: ABC transporter permease [Motilibacteraceae bacterium]
MTTQAAPALVEPGRSGGLLEVARNRFLLRLLVRQELRVRYRGSVLGLAWSYVKPAVQFLVYFFVLGVFLKVNRSLPDFALYLFAGLVVMTSFGEALGNATRSVVWNAPLVKKIYLPRELFPVSSLCVAGVHLVPQLVVLLVGALVVGWVPTVPAVVAAVLALAISATTALGLGLLMAAVNVSFRDIENIVDLLLLVLTWASPVLYPWTAVRDALGDGALLQLYLANPLTIAVQLVQRAFWATDAERAASLVPHLWERGLAALLLGCGLLALGQLVFSRLEGRFAQEL